VEEVYPALILAPLRVARSTWPDEIKKWSHLSHLRVSVISGTPKQRERAARADADIFTTNYDNLVWLRKFFGDDWPFRTVIADEATRLKSFRLRQGGSRARALGQVAHSHVSRFIGLTGTPAPNGVKDLWGQVWFLDQGERLGRTFSAFEQRWFRKGYDGYSLVPYDHTQEEVEGRLKDICLTVTGLDVDEPIVNPIYVDLPPMARKVYDAMEKEMFAVLNEEGVEAANAAVRTQKCLQLANGALYIDDAGNWEEAHAAKLEALESIVEEANGAPVLVAYNFKHDLQRLQSRFRQGRVLDADPDTIKQWNAGQIPLLFAHPASAGHGLNLADGGNILAFFGVNWNLEEHLQIIERIGPLRQKQAGYDRPVFVYPTLARRTMDDLVMERLSSKRSVQDVLLEAMKRRKL
jgi:SNF2 family DNA or RNA helicase